MKNKFGFFAVFTEIQLTYKIMLVSQVQLNDSVFVYVAKCSPQ